MNPVAVELRKLTGLPAVGWSALAAVVLPPLLTAFNATHVRTALDAGRAGEVTSDRAVTGIGECMLAIAACSAVGVLAVGSEYRAQSADRGGGCQATTTALAAPRRWSAWAAKTAATALTLAALAVVSVGACLLVADRFLGPYAVPLDATRWAQGGRVVLYVVLSGLLGLGVTGLARHALVPLVYLVANSTVVSPTFLLTHVTSWAWYLPDTSGMRLLATEDAPEAPATVTAGVVMTVWVAALLVAAGWAQARRDA